MKASLFFPLGRVVYQGRTDSLPSCSILLMNHADPLYDDPRTEVRRLLDKYHLGRYKVYNFASELAQMTPPADVVDSRVERWGLGFVSLRPLLAAFRVRFRQGMLFFGLPDGKKKAETRCRNTQVAMIICRNQVRPTFSQFSAHPP